MATISNTPRPGYVWDSSDNVWYPIGTGPHTHADYITSSSAINPTIVDAKGDIIAATAADTVSRLAVGANDTVLTADSSTATGLKWATPSSGGMTLLQSLALTGSSVTSSTIAGTYTNLYVLIKNWYSDNGSAISMRLNGDTGSNYFHYYIRNDAGTISGAAPTTGSDIALSGASGTTSTYKELGYVEFTIPRYSATEYKAIFSNSYFGGTYKYFAIRYALWDNTAAITSLTIKCDGGNFSGGNAYIYGVK